MIVVFVLVALVVVLLRRRAMRRRTLAGLDGSRPVFSVDPPTRRLGSRRWEAL
jgi:hypothetical protein